MTFLNPLGSPVPTGPVSFLTPPSTFPYGPSSGIPAPGSLGARLLGVPAPANNTYGLTNPAPGTLGSRLTGTTSTIGGRAPVSNLASRIAGSVAPSSAPSSSGGTTALRRLGRTVGGRSAGGSPLWGKGGLLRSGLGAGLKGGALAYGGSLAAGALGDVVAGDTVDDPNDIDYADAGQFISGAGAGAGLGAGVGSFFGPVGAGVGFTVGGIGGGIASALGLFDSDKDDGGVADIYASPESSLSTFEQAVDKGFSELPARIRNQVKSLVELDLAGAETPEERQQIVVGGVQELMAAEQQEQVNAQQVANSLAYQAQAAQILQPFAQQNQATADLAAQMFGNTRDTLPANLQPLADYQSLAAQQGADAMTQHLFTTALAQPRVDALMAQQQQIQSVAAQIVNSLQQPNIAAVAGVGGGAGASEYADLAAELGVAG